MLARAGIVNFGLRALTQIARLVVTLVVARFLGIADLGLYRMFSIYSDYAKQLSGLSLHTFLARDMHAHPREYWPTLFSHALRFHVTLSFPSLLVWLALFATDLLPWWTCLPFFLTVVADIISTTAENYLVAVGKPVASGVVLFIRQALWVYAITAMILVAGSGLTLSILLWAWVAGSLLATTVCLTYLLRHRLATVRMAARDANWQRSGFRIGLTYTVTGFLMYLVTTAPTLVLGVLGTTEEVGVLSFFFTMFSTVGTLVYAAVISVALPGLLAAGRESDRTALDRLFRSVARRAAGLTVVLTGLAAAAIPILVQIVGKTELQGQLTVAVLCGAAGILFSLVQLPYLRLYVMGDDRGLLLATTGVAVFGIAAAVGMILGMGLLGAAICLITNHAVLGSVFLIRHRQVDRQASAGVTEDDDRTNLGT